MSCSSYVCRLEIHFDKFICIEEHVKPTIMMVSVVLYPEYSNGKVSMDVTVVCV
mgnify:CR=1 FL=1